MSPARVLSASKICIDDVGDEPTTEQALLIKLTCEEIAAFMEQPTDLVMRTPKDSATHEDRPVYDAPHDWFRALVL